MSSPIIAAAPFLERLVTKIKTPLSITGLIVIVAGIIATRTMAPDQIALQAVIGALGVDFLIFGLAFNTIEHIEHSKRHTYIIMLFSVFSVITAIIVFTAVYYLLELKRIDNEIPVSLPVPPIGVGSGSAFIPLPRDALEPDQLDSKKLSADTLARKVGRLELQFFPSGWMEGYPPRAKQKPKYVNVNAKKGLTLQTGGFVWEGKGAFGRFAVVGGMKVPIP